RGQMAKGPAQHITRTSRAKTNRTRVFGINVSCSSRCDKIFVQMKAASRGVGDALTGLTTTTTEISLWLRTAYPLTSHNATACRAASDNVSVIRTLIAPIARL